MSSPSNAPALAPAPSPAAAPAAAEPLPAGVTPMLVAERGAKKGAQYLIYEGKNFLGRTDEEPVDINLDDQEHGEQIWSSRQHACITLENGTMVIEDLKSSNGTYVNRARLQPDQKHPLKPGDLIQIGAIHLRVKA